MREGYEPARPYYAARPHDARVPHAHDPSATMIAEVAHFFRELRGALRMSPEQAAGALATRVDIIFAFEHGHISSLPPWPETCRIVRTYAGFARLDPRPILHQLEQLTVMAPHMPPAPPPKKQARQMPGGRPNVPLKTALEGTGKRAAQAARGLRDALNDRAGRPGMALFTVTMGIALVLLVTQTAVLEAAVGQLPSSMKRFVRGAQDYVIVQFAPVRDGHRWIDVDDPRSRRADKLQTAAQSD